MTLKHLSLPSSPRTLDPFDPRNMSVSSHPPDHESDQEDKETVATPETNDSPSPVIHSYVGLDELAQQETANDIDLLIAELEEEDGKEPDPEVITNGDGTDLRYHADLLEINVNLGLNDAEIIAARRKYGRNRLKQEHRNNLVKFLVLFVGPVQFVMEVCSPACAYTSF